MMLGRLCVVSMIRSAISANALRSRVLEVTSKDLMLIGGDLPTAYVASRLERCRPQDFSFLEGVVSVFCPLARGHLINAVFAFAWNLIIFV